MAVIALNPSKLKDHVRWSGRWAYGQDSCVEGQCSTGRKSGISPPAVSGEVEPFQGEQRNSASDRTLAGAAPGLPGECWGRMACIARQHQNIQNQCFPQAAQLLKMANDYFCSFLSLGLFMHLKWAVKGILCIRQTSALKEAGWRKECRHIKCQLLCFSFSLTNSGLKWQGIKLM